MYFTQRIIHNTTDISTQVNDYRTGTYVMAYESGQYLYIGSEAPFNHLFFDVNVANDVAATASVEIWFGNSWNAAVDVIDTTKNASGVSLAQDGYIVFTPDWQKGWDIEAKSSDVTGLSTTNVYNMYWARIAWSQTLKVTTSLDYIGQKFSDDNALFSQYPDLNNSRLMLSFKALKTSWEEQEYMAAEAIVRELKSRMIIKSKFNILDYNALQWASIHKTAQIIYAGSGANRKEDAAAAGKAYSEAMNAKLYSVDTNNNATLDPTEKTMSTIWGTR
jgi:hypothetical protein